MKTLRYWLYGIRFYIAVGSLLVTGLTIWWAESAYGGSSLASIRIEEIFAWLATGLLALAIGIGPTYKLFPRLGGRQVLFDARRLIGISAAWFAALHAGTAYVALFHAANPFSLPGNYRLAFSLGLGAILILLAMAATSFDKAFRSMGIWWFRLHRLVYVAVILVLFHLFMIGVHATQPVVIVLLAAVCAAVLLVYAGISIRARKISVWQLVGVASMTVLLAVAIAYGFHQRHVAVVHMAQSTTGVPS